MLHGAKLPEQIREKKGFWARMYYTIEDYSEQSSIQGIKYIFQSGQSLVARLFWVNVVIGMLILSGYMSFQAFVEWETSPVLTTVSSTSYPLQKIPFPTVTICGQGLNEEVLNSAITEQLMSFLVYSKVESNKTSLEWTELLFYKNFSDLTTSDNSSLKLLANLYERKIEEFLAITFPGAGMRDPLLSLVRLMASKNPTDLAKTLSEQGKVNIPKNMEVFTSFYNSSNNSHRTKNSTEKLKEFLSQENLETRSERRKRKNVFKAFFKRIDRTRSLPGLFSILWFSTIPCFDQIQMTSRKHGEKGVLRYCQWKGISIPCEAIFVPSPTDRGICCSFNIKAAEEIFREADFAKIVTSLQNKTKQQSFENITLPDWYQEANEPVSQPGINKGLLVMLDAHTDLLADGSVDSDYEGFTGMISNIESFPLTINRGFHIKPGHKTLVALTATKIDSSKGIRSILPSDRQCLFPDESQRLKLHKFYTQSNCFLECYLFYGQRMLSQKYNTQPCTPWFLPFHGKAKVFCDPWEALKLYDFMYHKIPDEECSHCYPACETVIYHHTESSVPFRTCDDTNLGVSRLCNFEDNTLPQPRIWGHLVKQEFDYQDEKFLDSIESSQRTLKRDSFIFSKQPRVYNAYEKDIAMVQVYFDTTPIIQFSSKPRQTWVSFFSTIGGVLGLCEGISLITFVEIIWLFCQMLNRAFGQIGQRQFRRQDHSLNDRYCGEMLQGNQLSLA